MLQDNVVVEVERRSETGKNACNRLRAKDFIPAVLYGGGAGTESLPLSVPRAALLGLFRKGLHQNAVFLLSLKGTDEKRHVMVRDVTVSPLTRALLHVDFVRVLLDRKLKVRVPVETVGIPHGVKEGGLLDVVTHALDVECFPADIPAHIQVDVSGLGTNDVLRVADLKVDGKLRILGEKDRVVAHVFVPRAEATETAATTTEAAAAAPAAEPEVMKKGKKEEEGAAAPAKAEKKEKK